MTHTCDNRCKGDDGHHAWPSPQAGECLCRQKTHCPLHGPKGLSLTTEPEIEEAYKIGRTGNTYYLLDRNDIPATGTLTIEQAVFLVDFVNSAYAAGFDAGARQAIDQQKGGDTDGVP